MAQRDSNMGLTLVLMTMMWAVSLAQLNCPPPIISFQSCIGYITSNSSTPPPQCCTQLATMVQSQAQCLCSIISVAPQLPFNVNRTQAINLPGACNIQAPPLSQCNAQSGPSIPVVGSPPSASIAPSPTPQSSLPSNPSDISPAPTTSTPAHSVPGVPTAKGGSKSVPTKGQQTSPATTSSSSSSSSLFFLSAAAALALSSF